MFKRDPEKAAIRAAQREQRLAEKADLKAWRDRHPAEKQLNAAAMMRPWPSSERGVTSCGPVVGGSAEFFNADAHKAWTATRLAAGVATMGLSAAATGRKNKGAAVINIVFGNGNVKSFPVKPDSTSLTAANKYVTAFNALAVQLAAEFGSP